MQRHGLLIFFAMASAACDETRESPSSNASPKPVVAAPTKPLVFADEQGQHTLVHGNAVVTDRGLEVHLTDVPIECPTAFASPGHTFWFTIPVGPEALWVGQEIDPHAFFRDALAAPRELPRHRVSLRVAAIDDGRIRGRVAVAKSDVDAPSSASGDGEFDLALCDPSAVDELRKAPAQSQGPLAGTLLGKPFQLDRALVGTRGAGGLVFTDQATTCADIEPSNAPARARPSKGRSIRLNDFRESATPRPAGGTIMTSTPTEDGRLATIEDDMPVGFSLTLEGDLATPGAKVRGVLRGYSTKPGREMDLGGAYEAEVCAW
jgi:hypothetical protein